MGKARRCLVPEPFVADAKRKRQRNQQGEETKVTTCARGIRARFVNAHLSGANVGHPPSPLSFTGLVTRWPIVVNCAEGDNLPMKCGLVPQLVVAVLTLFYACAAMAQDEGYVPESPVVKSAEMPLYPDLARIARIQGTVRIEITTDGNTITKLTSSGAHKMLLDAAEQNIRSWHFYRHKPQKFIVTFVYKLEAPEVFGFVNPTVLLELPSRVEVRTKMSMPMPQQ